MWCVPFFGTVDVLTTNAKKREKRCWGGGIRERKGSEHKGAKRERRSFPPRRSSSMSSEEDVPAPAAAVLARRASRKVKPMRDEPGSDSDADESK